MKQPQFADLVDSTVQFFGIGTVDLAAFVAAVQPVATAAGYEFDIGADNVSDMLWIGGIAIGSERTLSIQLKDRADAIYLPERIIRHQDPVRAAQLLRLNKMCLASIVTASRAEAALITANAELKAINAALSQFQNDNPDITL